MQRAYPTPSLQLARWPSTALADEMSDIQRETNPGLTDECMHQAGRLTQPRYTHCRDAFSVAAPSLSLQFLPNAASRQLNACGASPRHEPAPAIAMLWQLRPV